MNRPSSKASFSIPGPTGRTVVLSGDLSLPKVEPLTIIEIRNGAAAGALAEAKPSSKESIRSFAAQLAQSKPDLPAFHDELEGHIDPPATDFDFETAKALTEFAVWKAISRKHPAFHAITAREFLDLVFEVHRRLGTGQNGWRGGPVGLRPDSIGNRILFPHHDKVLPILGSAHQYLCRHSESHPLAGACAVFAAIMYAHPFTDGNGRTARIVYNLVLGSAVPTRHFLPIQLFGATHRAAFIIKLRRALYGGEWTPLQEFLAQSVFVACELQSGEENVHANFE